jgi:hypothetical protein
MISKWLLAGILLLQFMADAQVYIARNGRVDFFSIDQSDIIRTYFHIAAFQVLNLFC